MEPLGAWEKEEHVDKKAVGSSKKCAGKPIRAVGV
jgi:hypothetical protein